MSSSDIPQAVRDLIARHIKTVKDLEILLLLLEKPHEWTVLAVADVMYIQVDSAFRILRGLADAGLLVQTIVDPATFRYDSTNPSNGAVHELARLYTRMRVRVIEIIYEDPDDPLQSFANAFKF